MSSFKLTVVSIALSLSAILAGCADVAGPDGEGVAGNDAPAASAAEGADDAKVGTTSSAMTTLASCASGADPNALGNLLSVGAFEEFLRKKSMIDFCELGTLDRRETIVDFSVAAQHTYEFIAAPNLYKTPKLDIPKDIVSCTNLRLEVQLQKLVGGSFQNIGAKVKKAGEWKGPLVGGHCEAPTHVYTRVNMIDSTTVGGETSKYRVIAKVETLGGAAESTYIRGRNLGNGY